MFFVSKDVSDLRLSFELCIINFFYHFFINKSNRLYFLNMSLCKDILHWTELPEEISEDFVSIDGDYDFPFYLSDKEEWINYKYLEKNKSRVVIVEPCLIIEVNRFVPYLENGRVKFHPLNMPYIKIGKIEIVGFVISFTEDEKFHEYQIDDGTGIISVMYEKKSVEADTRKRISIDQKYRNYARNIKIDLLPKQDCPSTFPNPRPQFNYRPGTSKRDIAILEHNWALETNNGSLGSGIARCDYVHTVGYCSLDFQFRTRPREEITFEHLSTAKLTFLATKVYRISESEYNAKLNSWLNTVIRRRYDKSQ